MKEKIKIAFICVHNSCRSQMAEAICNIKAGEVFTAYSAGTQIENSINKQAIETIKELYKFDIEETQHPKLIREIPLVDIVITMGCNVECPFLPCKYREDWGLDDPSGKGEEAFIKTAKLIEGKLKDLSEKILTLDVN